MSTPRVLLVDDERDIAEALSFALQTRGMEVEVVHDGDSALERAHADPPDLMVLDVMLPGTNGYEISRQLKDWMEASPEGVPFPILIITARRVSTADREEFLAVWSRADGVLYKPFELEDLHAKAQELLQPAARV